MVQGLVALVIVVLGVNAVSGDTRPVAGIKHNMPAVHALTGARIVTAPGKEIKRGTVVIRDGLIEAVGASVKVPKDARVWDLEGKSIYPGLIEPYAQVGLAGVQKKPASHWNPLVHPEFKVREAYKPTGAELKALQSLGFTAALAVPKTGIFRGQGSVVSLRSGDVRDTMIRPDVTQHLAFDRGSARNYPRSLMGVIALIRQTLLDTEWYREARAFDRKADDPQLEYNVSLDQLATTIDDRQPIIFESRGVLDHLRALEIAREFELDIWIRGRGDEYRELPRVVASKATILLPLNFPSNPSVSSLDDELNVSLTALQHWEAAPTNPRQLNDAGVPFVLTSSVLGTRASFSKQLTTAISEGLPEHVALAALTTRPAALLGVSSELGSIAKGKRAHLVVTEGKLFDSGRKIREVWIDGKRIEIDLKPEVDPRGDWDVLVEGEPESKALDLTVTGELTNLQGTITQDSVKIKISSMTLDGHRLSVVFPGDSLQAEGVFRAMVDVEADQLKGILVSPQGNRQGVTATRQVVEPKETAEPEKLAEAETPKVPEQTKVTFTYPPGAFGLDSPPKQIRWVMVKGATIWTCGDLGIIQGDLLVESGKIVAVGRDLDVPANTYLIDGTGKHVTPGLIDCHSHQGGQGGLNEGTQAVTCEVRIQDVIHPWTIGIYRMLAGGLTTMNVLHGSSNPIGGQNAVLKLKWGRSASDLMLKSAKPGVKFALGENVKRSNWRTPSSRYPRTRMGVEQIIRDRFMAARAYRSDLLDWEQNKKKRSRPRRDLELEALVEMLEGDRLIHSHSYRQDEILALIRVADDFGFTIGTFQHVLEGYKVAEAIATHGAGASCFSDWWAYKFEVFDAISYNGALMHKAGVNVSFNSDSGELARRMNLEAAKVVKDGGVSAEDALKFVTLNPAIQLGIDDRVGSLVPGKDADFVIWSGDPLSTYSICEETWIEGAQYFSLRTDKDLRARDRLERQRLIQKALGGKWTAEAKTEVSKSDKGGWYDFEETEVVELCQDRHGIAVEGRE
jgi:imidazolonepropionase-like amidohydrolase